MGYGHEDADLNSLITIGTAPSDPGRRIKSIDGEDLLIYTSKTEPGWSGGMIFAPRSSGGITPVLVAIHAGRVEKAGKGHVNFWLLLGVLPLRDA